MPILTHKELEDLQEQASRPSVGKVLKELNAKKKYRATIKKQKLDQGCWIMIVRKLPPMEFDPPPVMSLHWSTPWPMREEACVNQILFVDKDIWPGMREHNNLTARKIVFNEHEFRIFEDEFSTVTETNMEHYILGIDGNHSHDLRPARGVAEQELIHDVLHGERRLVYDAALVDGCTEAQAFQVAMGRDITQAVKFPPIGWYECKEEYRKYFFH